MPLELNWYLENRVLTLTSHGEVSDQETLDIDQQVIDYLDQSDAPLVHFIMDRTNASSSFVNPAAQIKLATQLQWPKHPSASTGLINGMR